MAIDFDKYLYSKSTHYISNSGSDENKAYHGGKAGDQTGHEWELKSWYNRPWTVVLRYPDQAVALKIAELGIAAALNNKIGYDQDQRTSYWTQLKSVGYDPSKITVACEEDCTAGVSSNVKAAGYLFGIKALQNVTICSSRDMRSVFTKAGFKALTASKYLSSGKYLLPGDILLYENHHAATNITLGSEVKNEWHPEEKAPSEEIEPPVPEAPVIDIPTDDKPDVPVPCILVTGNTVNVRKGPSAEYESMGIVKKGKYLKWYRWAWSGWWLVEFEQATGWISAKYSEIFDDGNYTDEDEEDYDEDTVKG